MKFPIHAAKKIAVFRALQLGDMLCSVPALRALRHSYPNAEITLLGLPWAASFCERFSAYIDHFVHFPGYAGLPEQPFDEISWEQFQQHMRAQPFDLILQMQGNGSIVNAMLADLQAGPVAGFHSSGSFGNEEFFLEYPTGISEIERHLRLLLHLGIPSQGTGLEFPIQESEVRRLHSAVPFLSHGPYVCVHPGSRGGWRQWPVSHFACLADLCAAKGYAIVITGTKEEASVTAQVAELMDYPALDLSGKTGLGEIGQLIKESRLLISNCTGVSHIASATKTPSIIISMDGEPERWGPLDQSLHKTIDWTQEPDFSRVAMLTEEFL